MRRKQIPHDVFFDDGETEPAPQPPGRTAPPPEPEVASQTPSEPRPEKVQVCVYLTKDTARMLDLMQVNLQYDRGVKVTKSDLVNYAVRQIADDLDAIAQAAAAGELEA